MASVELVYCPSQNEVIRADIDYVAGMTVKDALATSAWFEQYPELRTCPMGIFSQCVTERDLLKPGDRIEFYRPLTLDPKDKRRLRAKKK